jgi:hypothetical protein
VKCRLVRLGGSRVARKYGLVYLLNSRLKRVVKECGGVMGCLISEYY